MEQKFFRAVWRWLWLIVLVTGLSGLITYWVSRSAPTTYEAEARLIVGPGLDSPVLDLDTLRTSGQLIQTYADMAGTPSFHRSIVSRLGLDITGIELSKNLEVVANEESQILTIRARHEEAVQAILIANTAAELLIEASPTSQGNAAAQLISEMQQQIARLEEDIANSKAIIIELETELQTTSDPIQQNLLTTQLSEERRFLSENNQALARLYETMQRPIANQIRFVEVANSAQRLDGGLNLKVLIGAMVGMMITLIPILTVTYYSDPVSTAKEVTALVNAPVLASLPRPDLMDKVTREGADIESAYTRSASYEAQRAMAARFLYSHEHSELHSVLFTSGRERHTDIVREVAAGFAVAAADALSRAKGDFRVLLVDATADESNLLTLLGVDSLAEDAVEVVADHFMVPVSWLPNLYVARRSTPEERTDRAHVPTLPASIERASQRRAIQEADGEERYGPQYELTIVIGPAVLDSAQSLYIAPDMDGVVMVTEAGTNRDQLKAAAEALWSVDAELVGSVLVKQRAPYRDLLEMVGNFRKRLAENGWRLSNPLALSQNRLGGHDEITTQPYE